MKIVFLLLILVAFSFVSFQVYKLYAEREGLQAEADKVTSKVSSLEGEQAGLKEQIDYFSDVRNLAKELKSLFNYKQPGEHMMIIVPKKGS